MFNTEPSPFGRVVVPDKLPSGIAVFYTTIDFDGRLNHDIERDISAFIKQRFGLTTTLTTCTQVHGVTVRRAKHETRWRECNSCDALWSPERGVALGIKVADCLPVSIADVSSHTIANIHSGWRGAVQNIVAVTVDELKIDRRNAVVYLGPSIRACCFEVGEEVAEHFAAEFVDRTRPKPHVDLTAYTTEVLVKRGFKRENIFDSGLCTRCDGSFFHSYRLQGKGGGRNLAFIAQ